MLEEQFLSALKSLKNELFNSFSNNQSTPNTKYLIAYSGGMDSHVLLHLCVKAKLNVRAVYIHHGLMQEADQWQEHCELVCKKLQVTFKAIAVDAKPALGESPEEAARNARYNALKEEIKAQEILLTAHHQNDQAETLLLQLMRGSGAAGLASMPNTQTFNTGFHARPMLDFTHDDIKHYAQQNQLQWIEDPSNTDTTIDRNFLRQQVIPLLQQRWPQVNRVIKKSADIQQENLELIDALAKIDFANAVSNNNHMVSINQLRDLSDARQFNVIKYWINLAGLDRPTRKILYQIQSSVIDAADDAEPLVAWNETEVRRFKNHIYVMPVLKEHDENSCISWNPKQPLEIPQLNLSVVSTSDINIGLSAKLLNQNLVFKFRQGGEKIKLMSQPHTASLKKLMQEKEIPPWQRSRIPLLYVDDKLACVCGYWLAGEFVDKGDNCWLPLVSNY